VLISPCAYADRGLSYRLELSPEEGGFRIAVDLDQPLPEALAGKAGFNLDFLPTAYFGKAFLADETPGIFPRHSTAEMRRGADGTAEPLPIASGTHLLLAPDDEHTHVSLRSDSGGPILLFDGAHPGAKRVSHVR
jgi:endoglucanase